MTEETCSLQAGQAVGEGRGYRTLWRHAPIDLTSSTRLHLLNASSPPQIITAWQLSPFHRVLGTSKVQQKGREEHEQSHHALSFPYYDTVNKQCGCSRPGHLTVILPHRSAHGWTVSTGMLTFAVCWGCCPFPITQRESPSCTATHSVQAGDHGCRTELLKFKNG